MATKEEIKEKATRDREIRAFYRRIDRGDPASWDWDQTDLTMDANWYDLDCSGVVPAGAIAIVFAVSISDATVNTYLRLRKNGNSNDINRGLVRIQVANVYNDAEFTVACDSNRIVEYYASAAIDSVYLGINAWWI